MVYIGCVPQRNVLSPIDNIELRNNSDKIIYEDIDKEYHNNLVFNGAYDGIQCSPEVEDYDAIWEKENFDKNESFKCTCYNYKVKTDQGNDLYIGFKTGFYLNTRVCYDSKKSIVEQPQIENLKLTVYKSRIHHIDLSTVKMITKSKIRQKSKFGKFPALVYDTNKERILWKVKHYFGKLNVSNYSGQN